MLVLLDNGHGGLINGEYQTAGHRSPVWDDGTQLFEGEFNRAIVKGVIQALTFLKIPCVVITPELTDIPVQTRVKRANGHDSHNAFLVSVHANAGGGSGFEVFSSPGNTPSDAMATIFGEVYHTAFPNRRLRTDYSDSDLDKEHAFYILKKTTMPAVLTENFFMDNEEECRTLLMTMEGRKRIIDFHVAAIVRIQQELF